MASALSARYRVPSSGQVSDFAVSWIVTACNSSGFIRTIFAAKEKMMAAWSRLCAAEYSWLFGLLRAGGPQRCASSRQAARVVFAFLRPMLIIARRVPWGLS